MGLTVLTVMPGVNPSAGAERSFATIAPELRRRGVRLHLAVFTARQGLVPELEQEGVVVHDLSGHTGVLGRAFALRRIIRSLDPSVVHATLWEAVVPSQLAAIGSRTPLVVSWAALGNSGDSTGTARWKLLAVRALDRLLARLSGCSFHAVTDGVASFNADRIAVPAARVRVVERGRPDVVPTTSTELELLRAELGLAESARVVVAIGRQEPVKDHLTLVRAAAAVEQSVPDVVFLVAGREGSATERVRSEIARLGVTERVRLIGQRDDVPALLELAEVFVLSSLSEGAAGGAIEAMRAGTAIVSTELEGQRGILVDGENSLLVPVGDADALAAALTSALTSPELAATLADAGRATFDERFTIGRSADGMVALYEELSSR